MKLKNCKRGTEVISKVTGLIYRILEKSTQGTLTLQCLSEGPLYGKYIMYRQPKTFRIARGL